MADEKKILKSYIEQISSSVLNKHNVTNFDVFLEKSSECSHFNIKNWLGEYVCIIKISKDSSLLKIKDSLAKLISKPVFLFSSNMDYLYWFEGEISLLQCHTEKIIDNSNLKKRNSDSDIDKLKTDTRLPQWLDNYIYNDLGAKYSPDFERYDYNLNLKESEVKVYLGTYFPRSYAESYCIVNDLLQNKKYLATLNKKTSISILDIGSGTGGNLIGLIYAFKRNICRAIKFEVIVIDGNEQSLKTLKTIVEALAINLHIKIDLTIINSTFNSISEIENVIEKLPNKKFDWVLSFKMVCEIIQKGIENLNSYFDLLKICSTKISESGLILLLDVTKKLSTTNYLPLLLNNQTNNFLQKNQQFKTLSPICCGVYGLHCKYDCFYQQTFRVSHKEKTQDVSKVAYRIIGFSIFVDLLIKEISKANYIITWRNQANIYVGEECCIYTKSNTESVDAYKLH